MGQPERVPIDCSRFEGLNGLFLELEVVLVWLAEDTDIEALRFSCLMAKGKSIECAEHFVHSTVVLGYIDSMYEIAGSFFLAYRVYTSGVQDQTFDRTTLGVALHLLELDEDVRIVKVLDGTVINP